MSRIDASRRHFLRAAAATSMVGPGAGFALNLATMAAAQAQHIMGKAVTPFLLQQVAAHTAGASLQANLALLRNNAAVAAQEAAALV